MSEAVNPQKAQPKPVRRAAGVARRREILVAALRLFRDKGFHGTSINDIGNEAGVTGPALYRHFAGKVDILAVALTEGADRIAAATHDALTRPSSDPEEALRTLVRAYVAVALDNVDVYVAYTLEARHLGDELRQELRDRQKRLRGRWGALLVGVHPHIQPHQAELMVSMAIYAVASLCREPSSLEREPLIDFASERVLALLKAPIHA
jgi:AcrR family transcriptional regulator